MKRLFTFDPADFAPTFAAREYVHIPRGLTEEFYAIACRQVEQALETNLMKQFAIGDKQQALYSFPDEDYLDEFLETVAELAGLEPKDLVISERHIKAYDEGANPKPNAHKDRFATQLALGFSIRVPKGATLVLYPRDQRDVNPFNSSTELRASLSTERLPETTLRDAKRLEIQDRPGDVMMFRGNSIWHLRERAAGTVMLYFKLNAYHCDPLGEDPRAAMVRQRTLARLVDSDDELAESIPILGRRVDAIVRRFNRHWQEVLGVILYGEKHFTIDEQEMLALRRMDGRRSLRDVIAGIVDGAPQRALLGKIRRLAQRGILDLLPPAAAATRSASALQTAQAQTGTAMYLS